MSTTLLAPSTILSPITDGQFTTPVAVNTVDPTHILVGGSAHIYMSPNQGTLGTLTAIDNAGVNSGGDVMVYGGFQNGVANPDLIYAASGANVLRETTAGGGFTSTSPGGGTIVGVTDNPNNWATVFAIDNNQVFESTNAGGKWVDVTSNLTSISGATFYSIAYVPGTTDDALVVGTSAGVFTAHVSQLGSAGAWVQFGANLPDVIVHDLQYDAHDNVLVAATMGRGAWLISATLLVPNYALLQQDATNFLLAQYATDPVVAQATVNGALTKLLTDLGDNVTHAMTTTGPDVPISMLNLTLPVSLILNDVYAQSPNIIADNATLVGVANTLGHGFQVV